MGRRVALKVTPARENDHGNLCGACYVHRSGVKNAKDSPKRAEAFKQMAKTFGVTVKDIFWTQGRYDIVTVVEAPDELSATALNLSLGALGNIRTEFAASLFGSRDDDDYRQDALIGGHKPTRRALIAMSVLPQKRTFAATVGMSALCHKRTSR